MTCSYSTSRKTVVIAFAFLLALFSLAATSSLAQDNPTDQMPKILPFDTVGGIEFQQRDFVVEDGYFKTEIRAQLVMTGKVTRERVEKLLQSEYDRLTAEEAYKFRRKPSGIYIYVYDRPNRRAAGWVGMLTWNDRQWEKNPPDPASIEPSIYLRDQVFRVYATATGDLYGLNEFQRVIIWQSFVDGKEKLEEDKDPGGDKTDPLGLNRGRKVPDLPSLIDNLKRTIARQNNISRYQLEMIIQEGYEKNWPREAVD